MQSVVRYSDADLAEFRQVIEKKLTEAQEQLRSLQQQIVEITENTDDEFGSDWIDDSSTSGNIEMLNNMAIRQRQHIRNLENALLRIRNKTYGICTVTGELIEKRRLLVVPTTTKRVEVKNGQVSSSASGSRAGSTESRARVEKKSSTSQSANKIITKVKRKAAVNAEQNKANAKSNDFFDDDFDQDDDDFGMKVSFLEDGEMIRVSMDKINGFDSDYSDDDDSYKSYRDDDDDDKDMED